MNLEQLPVPESGKTLTRIKTQIHGTSKQDAETPSHVWAGVSATLNKDSSGFQPFVSKKKVPNPY